MIQKWTLNPDLRKLLLDAIEDEYAEHDREAYLVFSRAVDATPDGQPLPDLADYGVSVEDGTPIIELYDEDGDSSFRRVATDAELVVTSVEFFGLDEYFSVVEVAE